MTWFWRLELIDSPLQALIVALAVVLLLVVFWFSRRRTRRGEPRRFSRRVLVALGAALIGGVVVTAVVEVLQAQNMFDGLLPAGTMRWVFGAGAAVGVGVLGVFSRPWWNRLLAVLLIVTALLAMALQVNRLYGVTHTPTAVFGVKGEPIGDLPKVDATDKATLASWKAPSDMPKVGTTGTLSGSLRIVPSKAYNGRDASVYLPPAALVKDPPKLPVIVAMMGQPGNPDPTIIAKQLDAYAAKHDGLAPITIVVDQLAGDESADPICLDSATYGAVATYVNVDVVSYVKSHFAVLDDPKNWAIAGYSNGGSCAWQWGTQFPETWGAILDVSGNEFPGSQHQAEVVKNLWNGDDAAYRAWLPEAQIAAHPGAYTGHLGVFSRGSEDTTFGPGQIANAQRAQDAGFEVKTTVVDGASHTGPAVPAGYAFAVDAFGTYTGLDAVTN